MSTQEIQNFLDEISQAMQELRDEKKRTARRLAPDFSVLDMTHQSRRGEVVLSKCFAELLNPEGSHGQGRLFLDKFLEKICKNPSWATGQTCTVDVEEQANEQRRIDIYLDFGSAGVIGIENKPWAGDQPNQLSDYADYLKNKATGEKKWLLLYFSNKNEPSEESITAGKLEEIKESGSFIHINYDQVIAWLDECLSETCSIKVQIFIEDLIQFIRLKINQELTVAEENKIMQIIKKNDENMKLAFDVFSSIKIFTNDLIENLKLSLEEPKKYTIKFNKKVKEIDIHDDICIYINNNKFKVSITFDFEEHHLSEFMFGVAKNIKQISKEDGLKIYQTLDKKYGEAYCKYDELQYGWQWCTTTENTIKIFNIGDIGDWWGNPIPWQMIQSGEMARRMLELADEVYALLENCPEAKV